MNFGAIKEEFNSLLDTVADGWRHLRQSAAGALTRFRPATGSALPTRNEVDDDFYVPSRGWAMLSGDVFEDENRLVVRLEVPGMNKDDITLEVQDDMLVVSGEKHFQRESTEGRWRVMQCAYGSFHRAVPLPVAVLADQAKASYDRGILRVELPKAQPGKPKSVSIRVD